MHGVRSLRLPVTALAASLALVGCSGGSGSAPGAAGPDDSPAATPLKVASVEPAVLAGTTPLVVTFKHSLAADSPLPSLVPSVPGSWARSGATATFTPTQAYPPNTTFRVRLAKLTGTPPKTIATPTSPEGSLRFAGQILSRLQYLPLDTAAAKPADAAAEAAAVYSPPKGKFTWRWSSTPEVIRKAWKPGLPNVVLRGAVIAFQHQWHLTQDGAIGPATWKALLKADQDGDIDPDQYSYVSADLFPRPQELTVWVDGTTKLTTPVNGGVPAAPTPLGTYPVYLRYTATTMQGTNPDGTKYKDKGVPWVNYFSGGSAVHGFQRAAYGYPQSVGCLELPPDVAKRVYDMIDYGTLVNVTGPYIKPPKEGVPSPPATPNPKHSKHPGHPTNPKHSTHPKPSSTPRSSVSPTASATAPDSPSATHTHQPTH